MRVKTKYQTRMVFRNKTIVFVVFIVLFSFGQTDGPGKKVNNGKENLKKLTRVNSFSKKIAKSTDTEQFEFPEELEIDFDVLGEAHERTRSRRVSSLREMPTYDSRGRKKTRDRRNQQFYVDGIGSYQVHAQQGLDGTVETDLKATYRNGKGEKCFYARGESHCWNIQGEGEFKDVSMEGDTREAPHDPDVSKRRRRQDGPLIYTDFDPERILKVVYVVDKTFMDWFRDLSGNDDIAVQDAQDYIIILNNELGTDWEWLTPFVSNGTLLVTEDSQIGTIEAFGTWVGNGNINQFQPYDHATLITKRDLVTPNGGGFLGIAFQSTVCDPRFSPFNVVSLIRDRLYDVAQTVAHEFGHALSSDHDEKKHGPCVGETYLMSVRAFDITNATMDTWKRWSECSVKSIVKHVSDFSGCLQNGGVTDDAFYDQLCRGVRGGNQFDVDYQCKTTCKVQTSEACGPSITVSTKKVPAQACWDDYIVSCTDSQGNCSSNTLTIFDGTPCLGSDPNLDYVCYRGDCLEM